jgi:hypothetical protein
MTDKAKLQALFDAALRDTTDFIGRMPKPAVPTPHPAVHRPLTAVPVRAGFKSMAASAVPANAGLKAW